MITLGIRTKRAWGTSSLHPVHITVCVYALFVFVQLCVHFYLQTYGKSWVNMSARMHMCILARVYDEKPDKMKGRRVEQGSVQARPLALIRLHD